MPLNRRNYLLNACTQLPLGALEEGLDAELEAELPCWAPLGYDLPMSESHFVKKPLVCLRGADYSHFDARYGIRADDEEMNRHVAWTREAYGIQGADQGPGLNAGLLLSEQRQFSDSAGSLGLQLADMLAAILQRALNNRLRPEGWSRIGRLFIADKRTPFLLLGSADVGGQTFGAQIERVWRALKTGNKKMLLRPVTNRLET